MTLLKTFVPRFLLFTFLVPTAFGQSIRYELGQRTRALEIAWLGQPDTGARQRASEYIKKSVNQFFALKLNEAARNMDEARNALRSTAERPILNQWAESLYVSPGTRLLDGRELAFSLDAFYPVSLEVPTSAKLRLSIGKQAVEYPIKSLPLKETLQLRPFTRDEDLELVSTIVIDGRELASSRQTISVVARAADRIKALNDAVGTASKASTDLETARTLAGILESLYDRKTLETNYPAASLLTEAEAILSSLGKGGAYYGSSHPGRHWITFSLPTGPLPARISVPAVKGTMPILIALHGAGGSENMMFDGYGNGEIVKMAESRGWIVVSPRATGTRPEAIAALVEALSSIYPVDRKRVFIAGHSMGAMLTLATVQVAPEKFAAAAPVSGGAAIRTVTDGFKALPFYVSAGSEDFALPGVHTLREALEKAGVTDLTYREYAGIEHLMAFEVSLKDVFAFFDRVSATRTRASK